MGTDCVDVCDALLTRMCSDCPRMKTDCMPVEDEANHNQMIICLNFIENRLKGIYPPEGEELDYPWNGD